MIHLRVVSPATTTPEVIYFLRADDAILNMVVLPGASEHPGGDTIHLEVLNGAANRVFAQLRVLGIVERGSVFAETVDTWLDPDRRRDDHARRPEADLGPRDAGLITLLG
jgi:hypothetical protein